MKKKIYTILGFLLITEGAPAVVWGAPDFFQEYSHYFSYDCDSFITGAKLKLAPAQFNISTDFSNFNYGISLFTDKYLKKYPCSFFIGNILISGTRGRLKDPELNSDSSGYANCYTQPSVVTVELPSSSTFTNPFSTFLEIGYEDENKTFSLFKLNGSYTPDFNIEDFSILGKLSFNKKVILTAATGISLFNIEEKQQTTWYSDLPYYGEKRSFCILNQIAFNFYDIFQSDFSVFIYDSIVNKMGCAYKIEATGKWKKFLTEMAVFYNPNYYLITSDNKILEPLSQIKCNFQYDFIPALKSGLTFYAKIPLTPPASPTLKFGVSATLTTSLTSILGNCSLTFQKDNNFYLSFCSTKLESSFTLGNFKHELNLSTQLYFSPEKLNTHCHSITLNSSIFVDFLTAGSTFSFSCNNHNFYNKKLKFGVSLNETYKKIIVIVKFNGEFCI